MRKRGFRAFVFLSAIFFGTIPQVYGGGYLVVSNTGVPYEWDNSIALPFSPDEGSLGVLSNTDAVGFTTDAFAAWAISSAALSFVKAGSLGLDVNTPKEIAMFDGVFNGQSAVIFDADGSLFAALGFPPGVLGFAGHEFVTTSEPFFIIEGIAALNGAFIDGNPANGELSVGEFRGVFVHEFGHWLNLDHSQINGIEIESGTPGVTCNDVETMYPFTIFDPFGEGTCDDESVTPNPDDIAWISKLYPGSSFSSFGAITGTILLSDGTTPFQGANVIARNLSSPFFDAVSNVSGYLFRNSSGGGGSSPSLMGSYEFPGLTGGSAYTVEVEPIDPAFMGGSSVGPLSHPAKLPGEPEFYNGANEAAENPPDDPAEATPVTAVAGGTVEGINIILSGSACPLAPSTATAATIARAEPGTKLTLDLSPLILLLALKGFFAARKLKADR